MFSILNTYAEPLTHQIILLPDLDWHKSVTITFENWSITQGNGNFKEIIIEGYAESNKHNMKQNESAGFYTNSFILYINDENFRQVDSYPHPFEWNWKDDTLKTKKFQIKFDVYDWVTQDTSIELYESTMGSVYAAEKLAKNVGIDIDSYKVGNLQQLDYKSNFSIPSSDGGGCLIATAAYGSELVPQVQQLRELRDNQLLQTESGTQFMNMFNDVYYSFSPIIADYERENPVFKEAVKLAITPMISSLSFLNYVDMNSESKILGYGISLILLNLGMYLGIPAVVIIGIRKRF